MTLYNTYTSGLTEICIYIQFDKSYYKYIQMKKIILQRATGLLILASALYTYDGHAQRTAAIKDTATFPDQYTLSGRKNLPLAFNDSLTLKSDTLTQWEQFKAQSEERIDANEKRIIELKAAAANKGEKMKGDYEKTISELERKNAGLKKRLANYKSDEKSDWRSFKQKLNKDINAITKSIGDIKLK